MDDPLLVRRFQRLGDLSRDRQGFIDRDRALRDAVGERRPFDQLQHERLHAVGVLQSVDRRDVRVIQRRENLASRWKRASLSGSAASEGGRVLIAT